VDFYEDAGISGSNGREKRPGLDRLLKDATARKINMIAAWSVDRLGRSLQHLVGFLNELQALNCHLYLHQQAIDTTTPSGRAMFRMCGVFAEVPPPYAHLQRRTRWLNPSLPLGTTPIPSVRRQYRSAAPAPTNPGSRR
jgi:Resolvase, N terminal domain